MFLLPLLVLVIAGFVAYTVLHRRALQPTGKIGAPASVAVQRATVWPTTIEGKVGIGAFALSFLPLVLVNVIQVQYLGLFVLPASLVLTGVARFAKHDHSTLVLIAFIVSALAALFRLLFLAGEVFIGHE